MQDDQILHDKTMRHMAQNHGMSYETALKEVSVSAQFSSFATASFSESLAADATDEKIDALANLYMLKHGVGYITALNKVDDVLRAESNLRPVSYSEVRSEDELLHLSATRHALDQCVSYSEALAHVSQLPGSAQRVASAVNVAFSEAANALQGQEIEIFRAGRRTTDAGEQINFNSQMLHEIATNYDPAISEAPLVVGHPDTDSPAHGWVQSLRVDGDALKMRAKQINPGFAEAIRSGTFKKRSASFYPPSSPYNPKPGSWYLKHVGWLGATSPAVKGLADVHFSGDEGMVTFTF